MYAKRARPFVPPWPYGPRGRPNVLARLSLRPAPQPGLSIPQKTGRRPLHTQAQPRELATHPPTPISIPHESVQVKSKPLRNADLRLPPWPVRAVARGARHSSGVNPDATAAAEGSPVPGTSPGHVSSQAMMPTRARQMPAVSRNPTHDWALGLMMNRPHAVMRRFSGGTASSSGRSSRSSWPMGT